MYLSRPPISPNVHTQLDSKPTVKLHRGKGNVTTAAVLDADEVRHPVTQQWVARYQNQQSTASKVPVKDTTNGGKFTKGR